jgi:hypothetical protein
VAAKDSPFGSDVDRHSGPTHSSSDFHVGLPNRHGMTASRKSVKMSVGDAMDLISRGELFLSREEIDRMHQFQDSQSVVVHVPIEILSPDLWDVSLSCRKDA